MDEGIRRFIQKSEVKREYHIEITQTHLSVGIDVREVFPGGPITAYKSAAFETLEIESAQVIIDVRFRDLYADDIDALIAWLQVAQSLARDLDRLIVTREDFQKPIGVTPKDGRLVAHFGDYPERS